ncbi:uncharacterized protein Bfra_005184 [Botrytis fragariae]|uniref:Uncharacterized protein n=1 Tax=Botrytis fragariae TaxID=1964551 RepID=A0A8H6EJ18_9HELO|nr:uncharacterized protein Bfra_005184 [Botrytis fragariae]KAF5873720.1 hypothetical protein Bfra_005184 [Botrytis fragariae]
MSKTYPALVGVVQRNNSYNVDGLYGNLAATKAIQEHVINNIQSDCSEIAGDLGMSYIYAGKLDGIKRQDMGISVTDPTKPNQQNSRTLRLNNTPGTGYDVSLNWTKGTHCTNLEFFDWVVEVIGALPIVNAQLGIQPTFSFTFLISAYLNGIAGHNRISGSIHSVIPNPQSFGRNSKPTSRSLFVTVVASSSMSSTATDSQSWGVNAGVEVGDKYGVKGTWEANLKANFNGKFSSTSTHLAFTTYTSITFAQLTLPANRVNCVHQMVFDQRTSLPYTAKVKVVPRLRFQNEYTIYGDGGSYDSSPYTAARKPAFKRSDRVCEYIEFICCMLSNFDVQCLPLCLSKDQQSTFEFRRTDETRDDARANADPWEWKLAMECTGYLEYYLDDLTTASNYEVYVKGKWEGITGKYAVTTVTSKNTMTTLLPPS